MSSSKDQEINTENSEHIENVDENVENIDENIENIENIENVDNNDPEDIHETNGFIFIYEYNGKLYPKLRYVQPSEGESVLIHPVYYSGYNNTMNSEELKWNKDTGKFVTTSTEGSWLDTLKNYKDIVYPIDTNDVVFYDEHYYHCDGCLLESLVDTFTIVPIEPRPENRAENRPENREDRNHENRNRDRKKSRPSKK